MWRENLKVDVNVVVVDDWQAYLDLLASDAPVTYRLGWAADFNDPDNFLREVFHSRFEHNRGHFSDAEFDRLVEQAATLGDPATRQALYIQAERILCEDEAAIIPVYHYTVSP
jgi:oligopeptide transport system substrate-binding protein